MIEDMTCPQGPKRSSSLEGVPRAFKDSACGIPSCGVVDRTGGVDNGTFRGGLEHDDLRRIARNGDIRIMGHDDDLTSLLREPWW
jgi:hypothetical protein